MKTNNNNFGFLRLLLASLVIVAHSSELIDGNRNRELLTNIFGTVSFGELAVDGFFLISGYLILKSFEYSSSLKSFLIKRILRIYPAFIVASLLSILIVAPLSAGTEILSTVPMREWLISLARGLFLLPPNVNGAFAGNHYQILNGSLWTIHYEFLCYLSVPVFFYLGLYKPKILLFVFILLASIFIYANAMHIDMTMSFLKIELDKIIRLMTAFIVGSMFYKFKDKVIWSKFYMYVSIIMLFISLFYVSIAEIGVMIFGGYLLFNFAFNYKSELLSKVGSKTDISYGVYIYAWPVQSLIVQYHPDIHPVVLILITLFAVMVLGYLSWIYIEQPFMSYKKKLANI